MGKRIEWNIAKNETLRKTRGVSFEEVYQLIVSDKLVDNIKHPNSANYPDQRIIVVIIGQYYYYIPYVEDEEKIFLKTIIPSRKIKRKYTKQK